MTDNFIQGQPDVLDLPFPNPYPPYPQTDDPTVEMLRFWGKVAIVVAAGIVIAAEYILSSDK